MIYLAFVDDWEGRGNGTGDPRVLQFEPMRHLVNIFNRNGIRATFNVEVMQQLAHRSMEKRFPELKAIADGWEQAVKDSFRQGHDIQLHIHPQWSDAQYEGHGNWKLCGDWSILNYSSQQIRTMIVAGKTYLESLLRKIDPGYSCVSFHAGSWCTAPSDSLLPILSELGFVFDMSIVAGIRYDTPHVKLDYTRCEEPFAPYYPDMRDARRVSRSVEPIVCIPTHGFSGARLALFRHDFSHVGMVLRRRLWALRKRNSAAPQESPHGRNGAEWINRGESDAVGFAKKVLKRYLGVQTRISDLSRMNYAMMRQMMVNVRKQAARSGLAHVPIILANHTKDVSDFSDIERFVTDIARSVDVETVTLSDIANGLRNGTFKVRTA
jgi:hypothetical protein